MGIKANWARPNNGRAKPIEKFWDYLKDNVDKLPIFQGAYCGKDPASKPEDFSRNNAVPIELYAAKLAEVLAEYNREHQHTGHGMYNKAPAQLCEELMQANPHKVWSRPTPEDLRLLCLEQRMLTLDNKSASISFKVEGYGKRRYWSNELATLPVSAREKKYGVFFNPDAPELPILVYDGLRFVCQADLVPKVGNKEQAAQHCATKAKFKKEGREQFKALKKAAPLALSAPNSLQSIPPIIIEKPVAPVVQLEPPKLKEISPGVWYDPSTGQTIGNGKPMKQARQLEDEEVEKYKRIKEEREAQRDKRFGTD